MKKSLLKAYESDASQLKGKAKDVIHPTTIAEVSKYVKEHKRIVPRGAGTGLAGGCVPQQGLDIVLDLSKLNHITELDVERQTVIVEAGVVLSDLQRYLKKYDLCFPINIASKNVATLGGMIATNASGGRGINYATTSHWLKWIEVVDDEGRIDKKGVTEITDYAGLEGTTGIIVRACLKLDTIKLRSASTLRINDLETALKLTKQLKQNHTVTMIELFDPQTSKWLGLKEGYNLVIEYGNDEGIIKGEAYEQLLELLDSVYTEAMARGFTRIEDPKIVVDRFDRLGSWLENRGVPYMGHLSTGVIHAFFDIVQEQHIPEMIKLVSRSGGKISGAFGIGLLKKTFVEMNDKRIFANIKKRTDPFSKFNTGKIL